MKEKYYKIRLTKKTMAKLFDVDGKEVEAFTADELKKKQEEAVAEHLKNNPDKSDEVTKLQTDLADAQKKLKDAEEGGSSDQQKARLKAAKDEAEKSLATITEKLTQEVNLLKDTFIGGTKSKVMKALAKGDKDLEAKIELKYSSLMKTGDYKTDEAGITQALTEATTLVTGNRPAPNFMDNISGAGERGAPQKNGNAQPETENSKAMRQAFGISDKSAEKYGGTDAATTKSV